MATRAVYTFKDAYGCQVHVYKHWDGDPPSATSWIENALPMAFELPRFEADEFAAAFIAANKKSEGDVRCTEHFSHHGDLDYRYEIEVKDSALFITAFAKGVPKKRGGKLFDHYDKLFAATLTEFKEKVNNEIVND